MALSVDRASIFIIKNLSLWLGFKKSTKASTLILVSLGNYINTSENSFTSSGIWVLYSELYQLRYTPLVLQ